MPAKKTDAVATEAAAPAVDPVANGEESPTVDAPARKRGQRKPKEKDNAPTRASTRLRAKAEDVVTAAKTEVKKAVNKAKGGRKRKNADTEETAPAEPAAAEAKEAPAANGDPVPAAEPIVEPAVAETTEAATGEPPLKKAKPASTRKPASRASKPPSKANVNKENVAKTAEPLPTVTEGGAAVPAAA